jgi:hypothetical protein
MTTVHAELIGNKVLLSRSDLDRLMELAHQTEAVTRETNEDDIPTFGIMRLAEQGGAFDWLSDEEDLYTVRDLKVRYR